MWREQGGMGLVGIFAKDFCERFGGNSCEPYRGGKAAGGVHSHVERTLLFAGEAALRVVELHRGDAEIGEDRIRFRASERGLDSSEVGFSNQETVLAEALAAQRRLGPRQLERIGVEADQTALGEDFSEQRAGVTAVAQRAIDDKGARLGIENLEDFLNQDRHMRSGGSFSRGEDFCDGLGMFRGIEFLVFLLEAAGIFSTVARTATVRLGRSFHSAKSCKFQLCDESHISDGVFCDRVAFFPNAIIPQPIKNKIPPIGVIAPSQRTLVTARM